MFLFFISLEKSMKLPKLCDGSVECRYEEDTIYPIERRLSKF